MCSLNAFQRVSRAEKDVCVSLDLASNSKSNAWVGVASHKVMLSAAGIAMASDPCSLSASTEGRKGASCFFSLVFIPQIVNEDPALLIVQGWTTSGMGAASGSGRLSV